MELLEVILASVVWPASLAVGQNLPLLPLALNAEICLPLDLEASYSTACQRRRLP